jgi:hypothetical protein
MAEVKRFGKHTYTLYSKTRTLTDARKEIRKAKEYGFERVKHSVTSGYPQSTNLYSIWVDVRSLKNPEQPAYQKGGIIHTRRIR